jgi:ABC-type branched-subunit amino acid transport system ATPase component
MTIPLLTLESFTAGYQSWPIVTDLDLQVREGRITTIVGPNAAGKTTIFRALFDSMAWLRGTVLWCGTPVRHLRDKRISPGDVAWVRQDRPIFERLTLEEALSAAMLGPEFTGLRARALDFIGGLRSTQSRRLSAILDWLPELKSREKNLLSRPMNAFSGGERALAAIAVGLVNMPRLICLDEPAANLDSVRIRRLQDLLRDYVDDRGAGCLIIEHRSSFVKGFSDEIVELEAVRDAAVHQYEKTGERSEPSVSAVSRGGDGGTVETDQ